MFNIFTFFKDHRNGITALIFLILAVTLMVSVRATSSGMNIIHQVVMDATGIVQNYLLLPLDILQGGRDRIQEMARLSEENLAMKEELLQLRPTGTAMEEMRMEIQRLRKLLDMPIDPGFRRLAGRVVGESSSAFSRAFLINAGRINGVTMDAVAVNDAGLAGRVVQLGDYTALVLALPDINARVPVLSQRSRVQGIVTGSNALHLDLTFVPTGADIQEGDTLLTSGVDGIFPKGLMVGTVASISSQGDEGLFLKITVKPGVDFSRIEEIAILLPLPSLEKSLPAPEKSPATKPPAATKTPAAKPTAPGAKPPTPAASSHAATAAPGAKPPTPAASSHAATAAPGTKPPTPAASPQAATAAPGTKPPTPAASPQAATVSPVTPEANSQNPVVKKP